MKKNICFAGFAESELPELRAATASSNPLWETHFVSDASAALALLAGKRFDALVANMHMPDKGKNGAQLLREAHDISPNTLGFIVGEVTDQALIINCIGGTHQFIRRPFQPVKLIGVLKRGLKRDNWLATEDLRKLVPKLRRMPSLPSTYFNLTKEIESSTATTQGIGSVIARDPVATARLLQMCNSAAFALVQKVTDPVHAVALLGIETVKSLVMSLQIFSQSDAARGSGLSLEILWEHSLLVAKYARQITVKQTGDLKMAGEAFTAGLLHDVGRIVLASNLPKEYAEIIALAREESRPLHEEETAKLKVNHAEIGAYLLGLWGLPAEIVEAAGGHHAPGQTVYASEFSLLGAVHAANVFAHQMGGQTDGLCLPELDLHYFEMVKLTDQLPVWRECCTGEQAPAPMRLNANSDAETASNTDDKADGAAPAMAEKAKSGQLPTMTVKKPSAPLVPPIQPERTASHHFAFAWVAILVVFLIVGSLVFTHFHRKSGLAPEAASSPEPAAATEQANTVVVQPMLAAVNAQPLPAVVVTETNAERANTQAAPVIAKAPAGPFDGIVVQGISYQGANSLAIINGKTLGLGDRLNGVMVVEISQHSVTMAVGGQKKVFKFH